MGAVRRAARSGDGWLPMNLNLDAFRSGVVTLRELTRGQRCPTIALAFTVRIAKPDEPTTVRSTTPWMPTTVTGSPDDVGAHLERYRQAGLEYALPLFTSEDLDDLLRQQRIFAEQVAPRFAAVG